MTLMGRKDLISVILTTEMFVSIFFSVQDWVLARTDKLLFNFVKCHDEALPQKGSMTKSCFLISANVWPHYESVSNTS